MTMMLTASTDISLSILNINYGNTSSNHILNNIIASIIDKFVSKLKGIFFMNNSLIYLYAFIIVI